MSKSRLSPFIGMILGVAASFAIFFPIAYYIDLRLTTSLLEEERREVQDEALQLQREIESDLNLALSLTRGIEGPYAIKGNLSLAEFNLLAKELTSELDFVRNLAITEGTVLKFVFPLQGNESILGLDYKNIKAQWPAIDQAIRTRKPVIAGPLELIQGGIGLIQRTPVFKKSNGIPGEFLGLVSVVINVDALLTPVQNSNLEVAFRKLDVSGSPEDTFWGDLTLFLDDQNPIISNLYHRGGAWQMAVVPKQKWGSRVADEKERLHLLIYGIVLTLSLAAAYGGYYEVNRRQLSNAFKAGQARYLGLLENAPDAMLFLNNNGNVEEANRKAKDLLAFTNGGLIGRSFEALLPQRNNDQIYTNWEHLRSELETQQSIEGLEAKVRNGQGDIFDAEISMGFAGEDEARQIIVTLRDVTEKRQLQYERNLAEEILREAINTIPDGFALYDADDRLYLFNEAYAKIYAASAAALKIGTPFRDIIQYGLDNGQYPQAGESIEEKRDWLKKRLLAHQEPDDHALVQHTSDNRWLRITERKTPSGLTVGIRTDVTDIKATEAELREKKNLLEVQALELRELAREYLDEKVKAENATRAKSEFLAIISHELRTPMTGVMGLTDILLASNPTPEQLSHLKQIKSSANNLLELLNDILDFSKFEAGKLELEETDFDLMRLGKSVVDFLEPVASSKSITLASEIEVPAEDNILKGDVTRIRQILLNLASNAVKFTEKGSVHISIKPESSFDNYVDVCFTVKDTGIGISDEQIHSLFEPFTQADSSTTRKFGGTGLGLSISKKLVSAMGGLISVESELNKGSIFSFTLRLKRGDPTALVDETEKALNLLNRRLTDKGEG